MCSPNSLRCSILTRSAPTRRPPAPVPANSRSTSTKFKQCRSSSMPPWCRLTPTIRSNWCSMGATPAPSFRPAWKPPKPCSRDVSRRKSRWQAMSTLCTTSSLAGVSVPLNGLTTLVISINPINVGGIPVPPPFSGGLYEFAPNITLPPDPVNFLGLVTGGAFGASKVAAELADTGQVVETTTIGGGLYQLPLPASVNGTLYDLVASGPGFTYAFAHNVLVQRGRVESVQLDAAPTGKIALSGKVTDACSGAALPGATLEIVAPAAGSGADCTQIPLPSACVVWPAPIPTTPERTRCRPATSPAEFQCCSQRQLHDGRHRRRLRHGGLEPVGERRRRMLGGHGRRVQFRPWADRQSTAW